jgi:hypothetical protein
VIYGVKFLRWYLFIVVFLFFGLIIPTNVHAFTLTVNGVNKDGSSTLYSNFRWLLEEDLTFHPTPVPTPPNPNSAALGLNFHRSYMPVVATGDLTNVAALNAILEGNTTDYYFISIVPRDSGLWTMGGAPIKPGDTSVTVTLNQLPLPTAKISVLVFQDTQPINKAPDLPQELGLEGFIVNIAEPGGRFGASGGPITQDAFGNLPGTTYA